MNEIPKEYKPCISFINYIWFFDKWDFQKEKWKDTETPTNIDFWDIVMFSLKYKKHIKKEDFMKFLESKFILEMNKVRIVLTPTTFNEDTPSSISNNYSKFIRWIYENDDFKLKNMAHMEFGRDNLYHMESDILYNKVKFDFMNSKGDLYKFLELEKEV